ncbi:hypothetical protein AB5I41_03850 [Sphingomonas sp. MMS24-JH45]
MSTRRFESDTAGPFPDFVLVDGHFRRACALAVIREAQQRGADGDGDGRRLLCRTRPLSGGRGIAGTAHAPRPRGRLRLGGREPIPETAIEEAARDFR